MSPDLQDGVESSSNTTNPSPTDSTATYPLAGRKRKASTSGSRGVANLTPEQLAKKRANDREAQRAIRERTKNQIETLERRIQELSSQQPYQELQTILQQKKVIEQENKELRRSLTSISSIIRPLLGGHINSDVARAQEYGVAVDCSESGPQDQLSLDDGSVGTATLLPYSGAVQQQNGSSIPNQAPQNQTPWVVSPKPHLTGALSQSRIFTTDYIGNQQANKLAQGLHLSTPGAKLGTDPSRNGQYQIPDRQRIGLIRDAPPLPADSHITITAPYARNPIANGRGDVSPKKPWLAHSAPVRNLSPTCPLDGLLLDFLAEKKQRAAEGIPESKLVGPPYPNVTVLLKPERSAFSHPLSKVFTDILLTFPDLSALPEQVAVLYVMFLIMRWQICPTEENYNRLPEWATPRPSQLFTPHPAWIDHLPWPRMRDVMVQTYQNYPFVDFFIPYTTTLSLNWPYRPMDTLLPTPDSDEMVINPAFERHLRNLSNWSLGTAFARAMPVLGETATIKDVASEQTRP